MRTTVNITDELLVAARRRAQESGRSLGAVIDAALRRELSAPPPGARERPAVPIFRGGTGGRRGVDLSSNRALHEVLDEALPLNRRR